MKFIWRDEYGVGVEIIDEQHKHFFELANELFDLSVRDDFSRGNLFAFITELGNYSLYHLGTEEGYFKEFGFEDGGEHLGAHNAFRGKVSDYLTVARDEKSDLKKMAGEIADFSNDWLAHHILLLDKKYEEFFHAHGLS